MFPFLPSDNISLVWQKNSTVQAPDNIIINIYYLAQDLNLENRPHTTRRQFQVVITVTLTQEIEKTSDYWHLHALRRATAIIQTNKTIYRLLCAQHAVSTSTAAMRIAETHRITKKFSIGHRIVPSFIFSFISTNLTGYFLFSQF